ncbi:MAG: OmpA family protein [Acidobacteria bacterium]|nr:OmpA family protein [Acidobacteriota bacterium]
MRSSKTKFQLVVLAFILSLAGATFAQDNSAVPPLTPDPTVITRVVPVGQKLKVGGIVVKRDADTFTLRGPDGIETVVALTDKTTVKTVRKGLFRRDRPSGVSYILRGLRLEAEGTGNGEGQLAADKVRFDEEDLRTAQALDARVEPVETLAVSTRALAEDNQVRIAEAEQNAQRLAGQVEELGAVAASAGDAAKRAQVSADHAQADADTANGRINGLDDYEVVQSLTVHFRPGSAVLSLAAKDEIDEAAARVKAENLKGWIVEVVGYADSTGNTERNRSLSERRAEAVINYLVTKYDLPLRRLVQPFGYGSLNPVASNETGQGRSLNRRVEIKVMVNKGASSQASLK